MMAFASICSSTTVCRGATVYAKHIWQQSRAVLRCGNVILRLCIPECSVCDGPILLCRADSFVEERPASRQRPNDASTCKGNQETPLMTMEQT